MRVHTFISESVVQAVGQIRQQLGPDAVVLNVRRLPAEGHGFLLLPRFEKENGVKSALGSFRRTMISSNTPNVSQEAT